MTDSNGCDGGGERGLRLEAGSESPPSVGSVASSTGGREIDHSLFEGSSSEDECARGEQGSEREGQAGGSLEATPNLDIDPKRSRPSGVVEIDHDMFGGSDSDIDEVGPSAATPRDSNAHLGGLARPSPTPFAVSSLAPSKKSTATNSSGAGSDRAENLAPRKRNTVTSEEPQGTVSHCVGSEPALKRALISPKVPEVAGATERKKSPIDVEAPRKDAPPAAASNSVEQHRVPRKKKGQRQSSASASSVWARIKQQSTTMQGMTKSEGSSIPAGGVGKQASSSKPRSKFYPKVELEQYWRSIRNWDFLPALNSYASQSQSAAEEEMPGGHPALPIPDDFESIAHYKAIWAPLALREAKSQTLSEISASVEDLDASFVKVQRIGGDDSDVHSECITIVVREISGGAAAPSRGGRSSTGSSIVFENETILLVRDRNMLEFAAKGKIVSESSTSSPFSKWGLMGNAASRRKSVDGLTIKVSRRRWSSSGAPEMYLYRIGSNVTALREFTALSGADTIPLAGYLLGKKILPASETNGVLPGEPFDPLSEGGGANSLPAGFRIFVKANFNPSQLRAISAAAREYGSGGFTLVKGPPGTGKTTTLVALLNSLHLRQYQRYYSEIEKVTAEGNAGGMNEALAAIHATAKTEPCVLVCAPSNAAVDNIIAKVVQVQFVDGVGKKYRPSIVRVGAGQSSSVWKVSLQAKRDAILAVGNDPSNLEAIIADCRRRLKSYQKEIQKLQGRVKALADASPHDLSSEWEIRIDEETFDHSGKVIFINHKTKSATYNVPPPPQPHETILPTKDMPHYRNNVDNLCRYVEKHNDCSSQLEQYILVQNAYANISGRNYNKEMSQLNSMLESNILDSEHIVCTTLGSAGSKTMESIAKFEVVVVDEAAQCSEPATLVGLQLGSSHALLVGDPQQLPATIFSLSGRSTKYDRSLFQRLEEAGHDVHMLDTQYRMDPAISSFPRRIFYNNSLLDGPNVRNPQYGGKLSAAIAQSFPFFQHFTIFDLDSSEERGGTSLSNYDEAQLVLHLFCNLDNAAMGIPPDTSVAVITPYSQQVALLRRMFNEVLGESYSSKVEISTVDAFQGREACIVIFSCVRAAQKGGGIGFLSDVQRMNVALTRAKHFLFVIAHCQTIVVNPFWRDLVHHARQQGAIIPVPKIPKAQENGHEMFPHLSQLRPFLPRAVRPVPMKSEMLRRDTSTK